ncbi:squalene epoxidase [Saccharata proteae CBS 121410]|uniref:Squalene monooxygenase n=1 Tax=Saccharata proteae CBS 121410 TaxID=1314787 RepID=A0A9P4HUZ8_9PEZI|nr:squalene epoxidase [Saccharata proteae CBS 121410]
MTPADDPKSLRRRLHHDADVVIVGAGIVGCAAAVALGKQGRSVILLEKSLKEPDRIVGELLQPGGVDALRVLGLEHCLEGIDSIPCDGYDVIYYNNEVAIPYPREPGNEEKKRPQGRAFHHGRFIQKLREAAMRTPNVTVVETEAKELVRNGWTGQVLGVECLTQKKKDFYFGHLTIIADGYNSKFRKQNHPHTPDVRSKFFALELIDAQLPMPHHGHVLLGDGPPVLLYQIGTHETRALIDIPEGLPSASVKAGGVKNHLENVVLPSLPESIQPSFKAAMEQGKLRSMPNSFLPPATNRIPGLLMIGDAMNMRHPLTGGGMTVAFNDVVLLADLLSPERLPSLSDTNKVLQVMKSFHWQRKNWAAVINILALALYALFAANDSHLRALQLGCFRYFQRGGSCIDGPVGLLAGIIRQPLVLFYHFFAVALYAIWIRMRESSVLMLPWSLVGSLGVFWKACVVIGPYVWAEVLP